MFWYFDGLKPRPFIIHDTKKRSFEKSKQVHSGASIRGLVLHLLGKEAKEYC